MTFRVRTYPEILAIMFARGRGLLGNDLDLNEGSMVRTTLELAAFSDADQYVQISRLLKLFSIDDAAGDDLDARAEDLGAALFPEMRRLKARVSTVKLSIGDATLLKTTRLAADVVVGATSFSVFAGGGDSFPSSGAVVLERGTSRAEEVTYTRVGDIFSVSPTVFPHASGGEVLRVSTRSSLSLSSAAGTSSATLAAGTGAAWSASGSVVFERGTAREETKTYTISGDVLTLGTPLGFSHAAGSTVHKSTVGATRVASAGTQVYAPATDTSKQVTFRTLADATLLDGDFVSGLVDAESLAVGLDTRVGSNTVTRFVSSPFSDATVSNPTSAAGGSNREEDDAYRARLKAFIASLNAGVTPLGIETAVVGLRDEETNSEVAFAQIVEPIAPGKSILYISDGSALFSLATSVFSGYDVAISDASTGDRRGRLARQAPFAKVASPLSERSPRLFRSINRGTSTSVGPGYLEDTSQSMTADAYAGMYLKADDDQVFLVTSNTSIRFNLATGGTVPSAGSYAVLDLAPKAYKTGVSSSTAANTLTDASASMVVNEHAGRYLIASDGVLYQISSNTSTAFTVAASGATPASGAYTVVNSALSTPLVPDVDYTFNEATGDFELTTPLVAHDAVVASSLNAQGSVGAYTYTEGLGALVQRAVNGDPTEFVDFPGIRAAGTQVLVKAPTVVATTFEISILPAPSASVVALTPVIKSLVQIYVNSLGIGQEIVLSEIIRLVKDLSGVADVSIVSPTANVSVSDGQLPRIDESYVVVY